MYRCGGCGNRLSLKSPINTILANSENEGVLDALVEAGYVSKPIDWVRTGFVTCPICKLLKKN